MTIKEIAEILAENGHNIKIRKRSDGGYIISSIDSEKFRGAAGNIRARKIVGATLSAARSYQLSRIRPPKKVAPMKRKQKPLPTELLKELRKVQREWRKNHPDISGTASMKGLRYQYEQYGKEAAMASLNKNYRYAQGFAYIENVNWLVQRWESATNKAPMQDLSDLEEIISLIKSKSFVFKEDWISPIYYEAYYPYIQGVLDSAEALRIVQGILSA